jgi:hypothetical protein
MLVERVERVSVELDAETLDEALKRAKDGEGKLLERVSCYVTGTTATDRQKIDG